MEILVLGGTRFFGKCLVELLVSKGHAVTIATRGKTIDFFGNTVNRLIIDRNDNDTMRKLSMREWDIVFDQTCFSPAVAATACEIFKGRVNRYIFTSSQVVYNSADYPTSEDDFNPYKYDIKIGDAMDYAEGKRSCEAVFFQRNLFPVVAVRFPIVLGIDDHTKRLIFHIERIVSEQAIGIPNPNALLSFISSTEAAKFLSWVAESVVEGPINACSIGEISLRHFISVIEKEVGKEAIIVSENRSTDNLSPYVLKQGSWYMDNSKARNYGFEFNKIADWLPKLVHMQLERLADDDRDLRRFL